MVEFCALESIRQGDEGVDVRVQGRSKVFSRLIWAGTVLLILVGLVALLRPQGYVPRPVSLVLLKAADFFSQSARRVERGFQALWNDSKLAEQRQTEQIQLQQLQLRVRELEANQRNLQAQLHNMQSLDFPSERTIPARILHYDPIPTLRSVALDVGSEDGVSPGDVVVAGGGLVGRVVRVRPRRSQVLLITDLKSVVDIRDLRTGAKGSLLGKTDPMTLERQGSLPKAEYVDRQEELVSGDLLVTSGLDEVFPQGIPVGVVEQVKTDATGMFWSAKVVPYVELGKLETVLVIRGRG